MSDPLKEIPGFDPDFEDSDSSLLSEESETETDSEEYDDFDARLKELGISLNDIVVVETPEGDLQTTYLKMEDQGSNNFYVIPDEGVEDIETKPGTPIYVRSSAAGPSSFAMKRSAVTICNDNICGTLIECDSDGLCDIRNGDQALVESYYQKKDTSDDSEEIPTNIYPLVSLRRLFGTPQEVLRDIRSSTKELNEKTEMMCNLKIRRAKNILTKLGQKFESLDEAINERFLSLNSASGILEKKIEFFRKQPNEEYREGYDLALQELRIRREQRRNTVAFCESVLGELLTLFANLDDQIDKSISSLYEETNTSSVPYSLS